MKRMDMKNAVKTELDHTFNVEGMGNLQDTMQLATGLKNILYLGGYEYSTDEIVSIVSCIGIIAIDEGKGVPPGVTDKEFVDNTNEMHQVMKDLREAGDQEHIDMITEIKEYVEQFRHDMTNSVKLLENNGLLPGLSIPKPPSTMYR